MAAEISPGVERSIRAFLESLAAKGGPPLHTLSVAAARDVLRSAQSGEVEVLPADISDRTLPAGTSGSVSARIVRPQSATGMLPGIVYFHGGGWVLGDKDTHDRLVREIANGAQAAVVFVNYTPSPEARFPVAIEEAYAATHWIASNGPTIGIDATRLAVAGDSVGGNMAAAVTMLAKERGGPSLVRQVLFYPVTDANFDTGSYRQFAEGHFLTRDAMQWSGTITRRTPTIAESLSPRLCRRPSNS